jgi:hypothetical protein
MMKQKKNYIKKNNLNQSGLTHQSHGLSREIITTS